MKVTKKILALVLAVVMLVSVFSIAASALSYNPSYTSGKYKLILTADKYEVKAGDTVTFYLAVDDSGETSDLGAWMTTLIYNNSQINPSSKTNTEFRQYINDSAKFMRQTSTVNFGLPISQVSGALNEEEKAYYNSAILMNGQIDTGLGIANQPGNGWDPRDAETPQMQFTMVVSNDVQPGDEIWVGNHEAVFVKNVSYLMPAGGTRFPLDQYDFSKAMVKLTVVSDEPVVTGPAVAKSKAQVKMTPIAADKVADAFDFRVISSISDADWDTYFANTEAGGNNAITKVGFVAYKGTDGFDMETAKSVAKGGSAAGYDVATTDYIQKADDSSDAYFGAIIKVTSAETRSDATYIAFVEYTDAEGATQYAFYDAAEQALLNTNYTTIVENYLKANPFAG